MFTKDGYHKALTSKTGDDAYILLGNGGHKKLTELLESASLGASGNSTTLSITVAGTTKSNSITVPYATKAGQWYTARTLTIGNKPQNVDGTSNVTWTLDDIGVYSKGTTDSTFVKKAGDTMSGSLAFTAGSARSKRLIYETDRNCGIKYDYAGNEALIISSGRYGPSAVKIYVSNGITLNDSDDQYTTGTPALDLKYNCAAINYNWGTSTPGYTLYVNGTGYFTQTIYSGVSSSTDLTHIPSSSEIALSTGNGNGSVSAWIWRENWASDNWGIFHNNSTDYLHIVGASTARLSINLGGGNIGIGTTSPSYKLHVIGDIYANGGWLRSSGQTGWYNESYGGGIWMNDSTYVRVYNGKYLYTTYQYYDVGNEDYTIDHVYASNDKYIRPMAFSTFTTKLLSQFGITTDTRRSKNSSNADIESVTGYVMKNKSFIDIWGFAPTATYRTTKDRPAPYGIGFTDGSDSGGIMPVGDSNALKEIRFYGANSGPTHFTFGRMNWESTSYDSDNSNSFSLYTDINGTNGDIWTSGSVAIGTSSFADKLRVYGGILRIDANSAYVRIGPQNSSWCHYESSVNHWFNTSVCINGQLYPYSNATYDLGGSSNKWRYFYLNNRMYTDEWIEFSGSSGLYWPNSNEAAHIYPNTTTSYGAFLIRGARNGYAGIQLGRNGTNTGYMTIMDNQDDKGLYEEDWNWILYFNRRNKKLSFRTSSDLGADNNFAGSVRTDSTYYGYGLYHLSYGSSAYALTSDGGAAHIGSMSVSYANSAGNSDTVDNYHASQLWRSDGGTWNPSANITLNASGNGQEWSFDIYRNGYTSCYWHVWDSSRSTMLQVTPDDGKVRAPYGFVGNLEGNASSASSASSATNATNLMPENTPHYFRDSGNSSWRGGMFWGSAGSESMSFVVVNGGTRFQFVGGSDIASWNSSTWQSVTPYLTIYSSGIVTSGSATATGFVKSGSSDSYVLLGGGGHKLESNLSVSYANSAGSAGNADTVDGYHASSFALSGHTHSYIKGPDNRGTNNAPSWYMSNIGSASVYTEFTNASSASGSWENRVTFTPWNDVSGNMPVQMAFNNDGVHIRTSASSSSWNSWYKVMTQQHQPYYYSYYWSGAGNFYTDVDIRAYDGGGVIMIYGGWNLGSGDATKSYVIAVWCSFNSITQPKYNFLFDDGNLAGQGIDAIYVDGNGKLVIHTTMGGNYCAFIQKFDW